MEVKYKEIRERLKNHIEDNNGEGSWKKYYGSRLEGDIIRFVEKEFLNIEKILLTNSDKLTDKEKLRDILRTISFNQYKNKLID